MMSLLTIIDNPYQDIPLVSVLRSPIVGLKENELSTIRLKRPFGYYYDALQAYIRAEDLTEEEHVLQEKLNTFHQRSVEWRVRARRGMLSDLIGKSIKKHTCLITLGDYRRLNNDKRTYMPYTNELKLMKK